MSAQAAETKTAAQAYVETNVDFDKTVAIKAGDMDFSPTPMVGVHRMMFERRGDEVAKRATSVVSYAPKSYFNSHVHGGGEEFITLEGVFSDEHGNYPKGTYVRNPVRSSHAPFSDDGCVIFVKLAQMPEDEASGQHVVDFNSGDWQAVGENIEKLALWSSEHEDTNMLRFAAGYASHEAQSFDRVSEYFVYEGDVNINGVDYVERSWVRIAAGEPITISSANGATVYNKLGTGFVRT